MDNGEKKQLFDKLDAVVKAVGDARVEQATNIGLLKGEVGELKGKVESLEKAHAQGPIACQENRRDIWRALNDTNDRAKKYTNGEIEKIRRSHAKTGAISGGGIAAFFLAVKEIIHLIFSR